MKVGLFLNHIDMVVGDGKIAKNLSDALEMLIPYGLECVDVKGIEIGKVHNITNLKKSLTDSGVKVSSYYYQPDFEWKRENIIESSRDGIKRHLENCAYLGSSMFMSVPDIAEEHSTKEERIECQKKVIEYFNETALMSKQYNISTVVENCAQDRFPYSTIEDFETVFEKTKDVDYVLDTGNFFFFNQNPLDAFEEFHHITRHAHLKDVTPNKNGLCSENGISGDSDELGSGIIDFVELFKKFKRYGYEGTGSIEISNIFDYDYRLAWDKIIRSFEYISKLRSDIGV